MPFNVFNDELGVAPVFRIMVRESGAAQEAASCMSLKEAQQKLRDTIRAMNLRTLRDGICRMVSIDQTLTLVGLGPSGSLALSDATAATLAAADRREEQDGTPATLKEALISIIGGYNPDEARFTPFNMVEVGNELRRLIDMFGDDARAEQFYTRPAPTGPRRDRVRKPARQS